MIATVEKWANVYQLRCRCICAYGSYNVIGAADVSQFVALFSIQSVFQSSKDTIAKLWRLRQAIQHHRVDLLGVNVRRMDEVCRRNAETVQSRLEVLTCMILTNSGLVATGIGRSVGP